MITTSPQNDKVTELPLKKVVLPVEEVVLNKHEVIEILKTLTGIKRRLELLLK